MSRDPGSPLDRILPRRGTGSVKWEYREQAAGHASRLEPAGDSEVIPMWVADMDFACPEAVVEAIRRRAAHPIFGYSAASAGFVRAFTDWAAARHGFQVDPAWVVPTEGIVPDLGLIVRTFLREGEGVILHPPVYYPFYGAVRHNGARIARCPLYTDRGPGNPYRLDLERFEQLALRPENRMTFLSSPHNPVGRVWTAAELEEVARIAERGDLLVVSDEIHADLLLEGGVFTPWLRAAARSAPRSFVCWAPSKTFNLAGLKASVLVIPDPELRARYRRARDRTGAYGVNPLSAAAAEAAWTGGAVWLDRVLRYLTGNAHRLHAFLEERPELGVRPTPIEGTYLAWLDFRHSGIQPAALEAFLLDEARLRLEDGAVFGPEGAGFARMNIACPRPLLDEALHRLEGALTRKTRSKTRTSAGRTKPAAQP